MDIFPTGPLKFSIKIPGIPASLQYLLLKLSSSLSTRKKTRNQIKNLRTVGPLLFESPGDIYR